MSQSTAKVSYLDLQEDGYYGYVIAHLDTEELLVADVAVAAKEIEEKLDFVKTVESKLSGTSVELIVHLSTTGRHTYLDEARKAKLSEVLAPKYTRKVSAAAVIIRKDGVHTQTRVTVSLRSGEALTGLKAARRLDGQDGILRARVASDARKLVFTMEEPAADDDNGKITAVVKKLAEKISAMLEVPITVTDSDPDAALDPANDYKSSTAEAKTEPVLAAS